MPSSPIRTGTLSETQFGSGDWLVVDVGFSKQSASCGFLGSDNDPQEVTFGELVKLITKETLNSKKAPLNLLIEAPLSIAFNKNGNPTGRRIEKRDTQTRYWYVGPGCCVLVATTHLLRQVLSSVPRREIRLFEGLASFKERGHSHTHSSDVTRLRQAIIDPKDARSEWVQPKDLRVLETDRLESAFSVSGMDFSIPPVLNLLD